MSVVRVLMAKRPVSASELDLSNITWYTVFHEAGINSADEQPKRYVPCTVQSTAHASTAILASMLLSLVVFIVCSNLEQTARSAVLYARVTVSENGVPQHLCRPYKRSMVNMETTLTSPRENHEHSV